MRHRLVLHVSSHPRRGEEKGRPPLELGLRRGGGGKRGGKGVVLESFLVLATVAAHQKREKKGEAPP